MLWILTILSHKTGVLRKYLGFFSIREPQMVLFWVRIIATIVIQTETILIKVQEIKITKLTLLWKAYMRVLAFLIIILKGNTWNHLRSLIFKVIILFYAGVIVNPSRKLANLFSKFRSIFYLRSKNRMKH